MGCLSFLLTLSWSRRGVSGLHKVKVAMHKNIYVKKNDAAVISLGTKNSVVDMQHVGNHPPLDECRKMTSHPQDLNLGPR